MTQHEWENSNDPPAMLAFLSLHPENVSNRTLRELACACCRFAVKHVTWGWSADAEELLQVLECYTKGDGGDLDLGKARQTAKELWQQSWTQHDSITRHVPDSSHYVWAADALVRALADDAFDAALGAANCAVSSFVGCPLCCMFNADDLERETQAKRSIAQIIREIFQPFPTE